MLILVVLSFLKTVEARLLMCNCFPASLIRQVVPHKGGLSVSEDRWSLIRVVFQSQKTGGPSQGWPVIKGSTGWIRSTAVVWRRPPGLLSSKVVLTAYVPKKR